jgi:hypothetical protein
VISAWGGAAARTKPGREQLILWGGGHGDYYGNEVYALNLYQSPATLTRLTDPSVVDLNGGDAFKSDSRPVSRHTYGGLAYLPGPDRLFSFEGARMPNGTGGGFTWTLDLSANPPQWQSMAGLKDSSVTGASCAYDPNTDAVLCNWGNLFQLLRYSFKDNAWTELTRRNDSIVSYTASAVIDPKRKRMYFFGGVDPLSPGNVAIRSIDISSGSIFAVSDITSQTQHTCDGLVKADYPGLAYDTALDRIVGWPNAGDTVYLFDPDTSRCTTQTFPNGPPGVSINGTFGRFAYFPSIDAFAVLTAADQDAYLLRLSSQSSKTTAGLDGLGSSTYTCIDVDGDGYGVGPGCLGPDADDSDAAIQSGAQAIAQYGSLKAFLAHLGYAPGRVWLLAPATANPPGNDATGMADDTSHPYLTYAAIATKVQAGDMVMPRNGWNGCIDPPSGVQGKPTIIMSYPGEIAVLDGTAGGCVRTIAKSWLVVDGLKTTGPANISSGTPDNSNVSLFHDNVFRHMETLGAGSQGLGGIAAFNGLVNITIELNVLHDVGKDGQHCLYLGSRGLPSSNVIVRKNICFNASWNGFHFNGRFTNLRVEQNIIHTVGISGISIQNGTSNSYFGNNLVFNAPTAGIELSNYPGDCAQFGQGGTGSICPYDQTGNVFESNTIYATDHDPILGIAASPRAVDVINYSVNKVGDLGHNTFRNNVFVGFGGQNHYPPVVFRDTDKDYLRSSTFANNVFWSADGSTAAIGFGPYTGSYGFQPYNCAQAAAITNLSGCFNQNPQFRSADPSYWNQPSKFDFTLLATSPAIARGLSAATPAYDIRGVVRQSPPSCGAYDVGNVKTPAPAGTPPPTSTPTPTATSGPGSASTPSPNSSSTSSGTSNWDSSGYGNYGGLWWNAPAQSESGWGLNLAHQGDVIFATWFIYDVDGRPWWLSMTANRVAEDTFSGTFYQTRGPSFSAIPFEPADVFYTAVGQGTLIFTDANTATFTYAVNGISQTKTLVRQVFGSAAATCAFGLTTNLAAAKNFQDIWWASPPGSEAGWGISITHQNDTIFAIWFTYDPDGSPVWLSVTASKTSPGIYAGLLYYTTGPGYDAASFDPRQVMYYPVGSATFTFSDGNDGIFAYTWNGVSQAKAITREVFRPPGTVCA